METPIGEFMSLGRKWILSVPKDFREESFRTAIGSEPKAKSSYLPGKWQKRRKATDPPLPKIQKQQKNFNCTRSVSFKNSVGMEFVLIPPGEFMMGSPEGEGYEKEHPQHKVTITKPFYLQITPVTQTQWKKVMRKNIFGMSKDPSHFKGGSFPVESISWHDAKEFIKKLNAMEDGGYRLPTEAEWEYACRAGNSNWYCFGDEISRLSAYAWFIDNSGDKTHPVKKKKPNAWGLYDMHGNVWEWCSDLYDNSYYSKSPSRNPENKTNGQYRVFRGGSWGAVPHRMRSAYRDYIMPDGWCSFLGFRCAQNF